MRKYFLILLLLVSAAGFSQTTPNIIYGKEVVIQTRDTSSAELTIKNSTRNVLGYFKNIGGGKGQYVLIPQSDITALPDSLLARYTKAQADARFKSISYVPAWLEITDKPANFSTTYALSNDIQDSLLNKVSRDGSYANPSWITSLDYSKLTGTVPTWNQNTTGNAATVTNGVYTTGSYANPSWITSLDYSKLTGTVPTWNQNTTGNAATVTNGVYTTGSYANPSWITEIAWSKVSGAPSFITGITGSMVTTALGYTPENLANKGIANGYADLDATGKIPASRIDFGQTGQTFVVASQSAMLAVSGANVGALAVRTDENKNYRLIAQPASTLGNWQVLLSPDAPVQSVNGFTGNVNLLTTHISEGSNYWWTAARSRAAQSLTTSGSSGAATYDNTTGVLNIPTYTLSGLGGQPALSGTGFVKISGTTISYDNSTYLTTETDPTIYSWAKAASKPTYSWGEITGTVPTWNQNTTGNAATATNVSASGVTGGAALALTDDANVTISQTGSSTALLAAKGLIMGWNGQLSVARGGTGQSTLAGVQSWLGLGSYAYRSSGLAELSGATFTGGVNGTTASFSTSISTNYLSISSINTELANINSTNANGGYITWRTNNVVIADIGTATQIFGSGGTETFGINARGARAFVLGSNNIERFRLASSGAASFTSSVTATSFIGGGTGLTSLPSNTALYPTLNQSTTGNAATVTNGVYTTGSYADPAWITSLNYSKLTGTVPTWNQNTTGNAATATNVAATGVTGGFALSLTDDVNVTISQSGSNTALLGAKGLSLGWSGQLSVARGGTGQSTLAGVQSWLGLGSYAYRSSGLAELSGATFTGTLSGTSTIFSGTGTFGNELKTLNAYGIRSYYGSSATGENIAFTSGQFVGWDGIYQSSGSTNSFGIWVKGGSELQVDFAITNAGNIGMGTSTPNFTATNRTVADINGALSSALALSSGGTLNGFFYGDAGAISLGSYTNIPVVFNTWSTERGRFSAAGKFLLNTTSDNEADILQANGTVLASSGILVNSSGSYPRVFVARGTYFGYSTSYPVIMFGSPTVGSGNPTLAFNVDPVANTNSSFSGNGSEYMWRNSGSFITPNSANTAYNTLFSWNSSGQVSFNSNLTASGFIKSGSSDSYFLTGGGGHVLASTYATASDLSLYVNMTGNQYEIAGEKTFLSNIATNGKMTAARILGSTASYTGTATISSTITTAFCSGSSYTLTMPSASGVTGQIMTVISNSNLTGITLSGVEGGSFTLVCNHSLVLVSNGTTWKIASSYQNSGACS